jgi:CHAT domain-containing protein
MSSKKLPYAIGSICPVGPDREQAAGLDILSAESLNGLARSFFAAGARAPLVSNWAVHSEVTQKLMTNFASAYQKSTAKSDALRSALLSLAQDQQYAHPYYWAPFDIIGF